MSMLTNYTSNAIKHANTHVRIELQGDQTLCHVAVHDDGPGVPAAFEPRLFQLYQTAKSHDGGTGLGLASVRAQAQALGGRCGHRASCLFNTGGYATLTAHILHAYTN